MRWFAIVVSLSLTALMQVSAAASPILDQSQAGHNIGTDVESTQDVAQTLTVGIAGRLTRVDVMVSWFDYRPTPPAGDLVLDIRPLTSGGSPVDAETSALARVSIPYSAVPTSIGPFLSVDLSAFAIDVVVGQQLAIVAQSEALISYDYVWWEQFDYNSSGPGAYAGGALWVRRSSEYDATPNQWRLNDSLGAVHDGAFRTFVEPVPEPESLVLLALGLTSLAVGRRARSARRTGSHQGCLSR